MGTPFSGIASPDSPLISPDNVSPKMLMTPHGPSEWDAS